MGHLSSCCHAALTEMTANGWACCSRCGQANRYPPATTQRDLVSWLFPTEKQKRPTHEPVFVRYGRRIELLRPEQVRGHPDGWSWSDI